MLRDLRRRHARQRGGTPLSYRELAAATGWSHGIVGEYLAGRVLPPTDRLDALVRLLGATPAEQGALATARDRVEEHRRRAAPAGGAVPRQLPAEVSGFTGRDAPLAVLDALLEGAGPGAPVAVVSGAAGVGKTALALRWAHRVAGRFPDGQLFLDLHGYDPQRPVDAGEALAVLLRGLGVADPTLPQGLDERAAAFRSRLAGRRVLVVLDNAHAAGQVRPLLPGSRTCAAVVTSRDDLAGLVVRDGARRVALDVLGDAEAVALLRTLIGDRVAAEPAAALALARLCARLPLALRVAAELAAARPGLTIADLVAELSRESRRLDLLDAAGDPHTAVRAVFSWSHRYLPAATVATFGLLGLHPGREFDAYAVAALDGGGLAPARTRLAELARAHQVEPGGAGYTMHDLLRAYAVERARATTSPAERAAARARLCDYYRYAAAAAVRAVFPHDPPAGAGPDPPPGLVLPPLAGPEPARAWLDRQRSNLVAVAEDAARRGWSGACVELSCLLWRYFEVGGHYQEALRVHTSAVAAAPVGSHARARALANLGNTHWWLGAYREARADFTESIAGHRAAGDADGEARALARLAMVHERLGCHPEALACLTEARARHRRTGNRHGEAAHLHNLGVLYRKLGRHRLAVAYLRLAARIFAELGDVRLEGYALGNLGVTYSLLGRHREALARLDRALAHCREAADPGGQGSALGAIGAVHLRLGHYPRALDHLHRALAVSRETGDRSLETETLNTLGEALRAVGQPEPAMERHRAALALAGRSGERAEQARALDGIGRLLCERGDAARGRERRRRALAIYQALGLPEAGELRARLAA